MPDEPKKSAKNEGTVPAPPSVSAQSPKEKDLKDLTPEEQMALYEEDLKENDWGHQPC